MVSDRALMVQQAWIVAAREYRERVRSRAFVLTTILTPLFLGAVLGGSFLLAVHTSSGQRIAVVANDRAEAVAVQHELSTEDHGPRQVDVVTPAGPPQLAQLNQELADKRINGYLLLDGPIDAETPRATYVSGSSADITTGSMLENALTRVRARAALVERGISPELAREAMQHVQVATEQLRHGTLVRADSAKSFGSAYGLVMLLYLVVLIYGMNVARSVVQEKTSRIYEVLLATARADSLMWGKLLGVGAAGLTQVGVWFLLLATLAGTSLASSYGLHGLASLGVRPAQIVFFLIFFALGFLYYSGISATLGAMVGAEQEIQQLSIVIVAPLIFAVIMLNYVLSNPDSTVSVVLSLIPPLTPIIMYLRICAQTPPAWQIALSIVLLIAAIAVVVWIAARIYRIGILMYGKRPTLPEAWRWLRSS